MTVALLNVKDYSYRNSSLISSMIFFSVHVPFSFEKALEAFVPFVGKITHNKKKKEKINNILVSTITQLPPVRIKIRRGKNYFQRNFN